MNYYFSNNSGETFKIINSNLPLNGTQGNIINFFDSLNGYTVEYYLGADALSKTSDGGKTWKRNSLSDNSYLHFLNVQNGMMSLPNTKYISITTNEGASWEKIYFPDSLNHYVRFILDSTFYFGDNENDISFKYKYGSNEIIKIDNYPFPINHLNAELYKMDNVIIQSLYALRRFYISLDYGLTWQKRTAPNYLDIFHFLLMALF